jgi:hypothetical protein
MNMKLSILLAFSIASCKHIPEQSVSDTLGTSFCTFPAGDSLCNDDWVPPLDPTYYGAQMLHGIHYMCPSVNPNNPNQFVCFKLNTLFPPKTDIIIYDMQTDEERTLFTYNSTIIGSLSWGKKDWIAYTSGQGTIRIFKSDGTGEHQIVASSGMNFLTGYGPEWSPDGNHLYYSLGLPNVSNAVICDTSGNTISHAPIIPKPDWNNNNVFIGGGGTKVRMAALSDSSAEIIASWTKQNILDEIISIEWLPDNRHAVFSKHYGLYRIDTQTGEILQMKDQCDMKNYSMLSVSNEGNFIFCQKRVSKKPSSQTLIYREEIWKMDINGCNEVRVLPRE